MADESESLYLLIDISANLTNRKFHKDLDAVIERAHHSGVNKMVVSGVSIQSSRDALRLSRLYPDELYCTAGVHPHDAKQWDHQSEDAIRELAQNGECVAIGECGLDFNRDFSPRETQLLVFEKQVQIACDLKQNGNEKPLFVHERDAHAPLLKVLDAYASRLPLVVIHCFTGDREEVRAYLERGFYIGLTGFLWKDRRESGIRAILERKEIPLERLMIESDCPFQYPNTRASKLDNQVKESLTERSLSFLNRYCTFQRNEPCSLPVTLEMISAQMKITAQELALKTTFNALKVFNINC